MGQTISGPLGFASFLNNVSRDVCHSASVSSFAFLGTMPSGSPLSLSFWPHTLPQQAFSDSCLQLLSQGWRLPNLFLRSLYLPSAWYAQLPSDLFSRMFLLDVISSLIHKRETHTLSSHLLPKAAFLPKLPTALPAHPFPYSVNLVLRN